MPGLPSELAVPSEILTVIDSSLRRVAEVFDRQLASDLPPVSKLCSHVERYRGKMLRPTLAIVSGLAGHPQAASARSADDLLGLITPHHHSVAAVCEMVHMATLVHDDVLDEAEVRRRGRTVNSLHGNEAAVILGDYLIASAFHLCSKLPTTAASLIVGHASMVLCGGELLQLTHRDDWSVDEPTYYEIVERKTAVLIAASARLGAEQSGADAATAHKLWEFGRQIGIAFQIQDDLLDLTGSEATVGKSVGKDIEKGKLTLPVIHHLGAADPATRTRALELLMQTDRPAGELVRLLERTDSLRHARATAQHLVERAKAELDGLADSAAKTTLVAMADAVVARAY